jgi:hypothetical protein
MFVPGGFSQSPLTMSSLTIRRTGQASPWHVCTTARADRCVGIPSPWRVGDSSYRNSRPQVSATQLPNGAANYKLQLAPSSGGGAQIGEVRIYNGQAFIRLAKLKADMAIGIATRDQGEQAQIVADACGTYNAQPITGYMVGGALLSLRDTAHPWPIDVRVQNGPTQVSLIGTVRDPMAMRGLM